MLKLLTLLIAGAAAAPQYAPYGYPLAYQPAYQYGYYPQYRYVTPQDLELQSRGIFDAFLPFSPFRIQSNKASFTTSGTYQKIQGEAKFDQNLFTGSNAKYDIWMKDPSDNSFHLKGNKYHIYVSTDCTTASGTLMTTVTAPQLMINGFYAKGTTSKWNIDGADGKTDITGKYVVVIKDGSSNVYGCTNKLA